MSTDSEKIILGLIRESTETHVARIVENAYIQAGNGDMKILDLLQRIAKLELPPSNYMTCLRVKLAEHKAEAI